MLDSNACEQHPQVYSVKSVDIPDDYVLALTLAAMQKVSAASHEACQEVLSGSTIGPISQFAQ